MLLEKKLKLSSKSSFNYQIEAGIFQNKAKDKHSYVKNVKFLFCPIFVMEYLQNMPTVMLLADSLSNAVMKFTPDNNSVSSPKQIRSYHCKKMFLFTINVEKYWLCWQYPKFKLTYNQILNLKL